jgi:DNA primase
VHIDRQLIQKISDELDIVKVISRYLVLNKKGSSYVGLCPFHDDHNASMSVSPSKHIFNCFSCGAKGGVINFVERIEKLSFTAAAIKLAKELNIDTDTLETLSENDYKMERYLKLLEDVTKAYSLFLTVAAQGKAAREYLNNRGIPLDAINYFRLGLAPEGNKLFSAFTSGQYNYSPLDLIEVGLINADHFDFFRDRIIFPIGDTLGRVIGFSGRLYGSNNSGNKYFNSSDTIVFKKGDQLYNYDRAINSINITKTVYLMEGYMDVIAAYRAGVLNAVASMGTALSETQIFKLKNAAEKIVVCYDGDEAGVTATIKAIKLFKKQKISVQAILFPDGLDPDEYLRKYGATELERFLKESTLSDMDYVLESAARKVNKDDLNSIEKYRIAVFDYLNGSSEVVVHKVLEKASKIVATDINNLLADYATFTKSSLAGSAKTYEKIAIKKPLLDSIPSKINAANNKQSYQLSENMLIRLIYKNKELLRNTLYILDGLYIEDLNKTIESKLNEYYKNNLEFDINIFRTMLSSTEFDAFEKIKDLPGGDVKNTGKNISRLINYLKQYNYGFAKIELEKKLAENPNDETTIVKYQEIIRKITTFKDEKHDDTEK